LRILDISTPISEGMPVFPGDPPLRIDRTRSLSRGDPYNLSQLSMGTHTGTHVDPPFHFVPGGASIDRIDLSLLNGPCEVLDLGPGHDRIGADALQRVPGDTRRLLFRTTNSRRWADSESFFSDYVALDPEGAEAAIAAGVRLVGIDSLSIERRESEFSVHRRLLGASVLILEGLRLAEAPAGHYQLRCLPLCIRDGDGGPARAVLLPDE
jgi:arylformamidase